MKNSGVLLGIGRLLSIEILDPRTNRSVSKSFSGKWLGWDPAKKRFSVCSIKGRGNGALSPRVVAAHREFHNANPRSVLEVDVPMPTGGLKQIGLVKALCYAVPKSVKSPGKNKYKWHHAFGDTGHQGGGEYPQKVMPALLRDARGNLFIKRRPGNIFTVDEWLRG